MKRLHIERRLAVVLGLVLAAVVAGVAALVIALCGDDSDADANAGVSSAPASTSSAPASPTGATEAPRGGEPSPSSGATPDAIDAPQVPVDANDPPPALDPVALDAGAEADGIEGSLVRVEEIEGSAQGPGNINGPALRITVRLVNGTIEELSLSGVAINVFHGADRTPAPPLEDRSQSPFAGALPPGDAAEGGYVFRVPADDRDDVRVEVGVRPGAPVLVFTGGI